MSKSSQLIRLAPLQPSELPSHPLLSSTNSEAAGRPDLLPFVLTLLKHADGALAPMAFNMMFKSHSHKPSPPSNNNVEALTASIPTEELAQIKWDETTQTGVGRNKPRDIPPEFWFARRSYHANVSSKQNPATASWDEFVFGLRDNHSKNEAEFTPTLYDARHILDWNEDIKAAADAWKVEHNGQAEAPTDSYTNITLAIYEMCHEVPFPLQPRCFPVLVATASTSPTRFIAVTVPVNLSSFDKAFYSTGRNRTEGETTLRRKQVVLGVYTAIESVSLIETETPDRAEDVEKKSSNAESTIAPKKEQSIEWVMATASDAKGNVPMIVQRPSMPGAVVKDVGFFLKWINTVDDAVIKGDKPQEFSNDVTGKSEDERRRSRTNSAR